MRVRRNGVRLSGYSVAVDGDDVWSLRYAISVDRAWATQRASVVGESQNGTSRVVVQRDDRGWRVDGLSVPNLDGCVDVDLEGSAFTNSLPVRRLALQVGEAADAPAAYVRVGGAHVERLEQRYRRLEDAGATTRYDYVAPGFNFRAALVYDRFGLILEYPGIAVRVR